MGVKVYCNTNTHQQLTYEMRPCLGIVTNNIRQEQPNLHQPVPTVALTSSVAGTHSCPHFECGRYPQLPSLRVWPVPTAALTPSVAGTHSCPHSECGRYPQLPSLRVWPVPTAALTPSVAGILQCTGLQTDLLDIDLLSLA